MGLKGIFKRLAGQTNTIVLQGNSGINKGSNVIIKNSMIDLNNASLTLGDNVVISNAVITITSGSMTVGEGSIIEGVQDSLIYIQTGKVEVGIKSRLQNSIIVRFGGICTIKDYTAINSGSEIRCDEQVAIGSFNMISYNCQINDTNTHNVLPVEERRALTMKEFPVIGSEYSRPATKPVSIGDDVWIGKGATILKGVTIGDRAVIGTQAVVTKNVPEGATAVGNPATVITK